MERKNRLADSILHRAIEELAEQQVPVAVTVDRMLTFAAAMSVAQDGAAHAAEQFRAAADRIANGALAKFEPLKN